MLDVLADNPVLTLFLVVGLGSALGLVPFGPIRFGPAGALFVGLALGAVDDRLGQDLGLARTIGLALFVYTVGLSSGSILIRTFRRQLPLMAGSALVLLVGVGTVLLGRLLGLSGAFQGGAFAGVGTSTPTLAAATAAAGGGTEPAVGYALTYPLGVVLGIIAVHLEMGRPRTTPRDPGSAAVAGLTDLTIVVGRRARLAEVPGAAEEAVRFSFWRHGGSVEVAGGDAVVEPGDHVVVVGAEEAVARAVRWLGTRADEHLAHDRREVDYRRVLLSNAPPGRGHRGRAGRRRPLRRGGHPGPPRRPRPAGPRRPARPAGRPAPGGRPPGPDGRAQPLPGRHRAPGQRGGRGQPRPRAHPRLPARAAVAAAGLGHPVAGSRPGRWSPGSCSAGGSGPGRSSGACPPGPA